MKLTSNLAQAKEINASADRYFLEGLIRNTERYPVGLERACDLGGDSGIAFLPGEGKGGPAASGRRGRAAEAHREAHAVREAM